MNYSKNYEAFRRLHENVSNMTVHWIGRNGTSSEFFDVTIGVYWSLKVWDTVSFFLSLKHELQQKLRSFPKAPRKRFQYDRALDWKEWNELWVFWRHNWCLLKFKSLRYCKFPSGFLWKCQGLGQCRVWTTPPNCQCLAFAIFQVILTGPILGDPGAVSGGQQAAYRDDGIFGRKFTTIYKIEVISILHWNLV